MVKHSMGEIMSYLFTSESVSEGHPDKVADAISDAVLDLMMRESNKAYRCACETLVTTNQVVLAGEYKGIYNHLEVENAVRRVIRDIGYEQDGFHWETAKIHNYMHGQSADIALGTDSFGAGDQGLMFGYAINETPDLMPSAIYYSHQIVKELTLRRKNGVTWLGPDAKSQVTIEYNDDGSVNRIAKIVCSTQHADSVDISEVRVAVESYIRDVLPKELIDSNTEFLINPTGRFVIGGPDGDTGLTGRKIIVDTYGGYSPHGGGAFSGKDPTKVDRSAAYMTRYLAKNIVATKDAHKATVQLSYAIGVKEPTSLFVKTDKGIEFDNSITAWLRENVDLTPAGIINRFELFRPIYSETTNYGHFGKANLPWETVDLFKD
jgi:S-adenosylmethionine synthetase